MGTELSLSLFSLFLFFLFLFFLFLFRLSVKRHLYKPNREANNDRGGKGEKKDQHTDRRTHTETERERSKESWVLAALRCLDAA